MQKMLIVMMLTTTPALAQFKPTPYAATETEADKNDCMKHAVPKPPAYMRHPQLSTARPESWDAGHESCEAIWVKWKAEFDAGQASRDANQAVGETEKRQMLDATRNQQ